MILKISFLYIHYIFIWYVIYDIALIFTSVEWHITYYVWFCKLKESSKYKSNIFNIFILLLLLLNLLSIISKYNNVE